MNEFSISVAPFKFRALEHGPQDGELVLCLHGFPQFSDCWRPILQRLGDQAYRAIAFDQRGYSLEAQPPRVADYSLDFLVGDVAAVAQALGSSNFHLVGHDWGGIVAWKFAALYPEQLKSLTVLSTPHMDALREALATDLDQKKKSSYIALFRAPFHIAEKVMRAFNWSFLRRAYGRYVSQTQIEENIARFSQGRTLTSALNYYRALRLTGTNGPVSVRTLFIWGSKDQALGRTAACDTSKYIDGEYHFEVLEGASHWLPDERPDHVSDLVLKHLGHPHK